MNSLDQILMVNELQESLIREFRALLLTQEGVFKDYQELSELVNAIRKLCYSVQSIVHEGNK